MSKNEPKKFILERVSGEFIEITATDVLIGEESHIITFYLGREPIAAYLNWNGYRIKIS